MGTKVYTTVEALFNPLNWERHDPVFLQMGISIVPANSVCQFIPGTPILCSASLPSVGIVPTALQPGAMKSHDGKEIAQPASIETRHYSARIDWKTGALVSLKLKPSGRDVLGGPANVIVAEKPKPQKGDYGDFMSPRPDRTRLATSSDFPCEIMVWTGSLATSVHVKTKFYGGADSRRVIRFYHDYPRVDFETEVQDIPDVTVVVAEFPLAGEITEVRRGIPGGFSHGAWARPNPDLVGWTKGIVPAVRWSDYAFADGSGVAILRPRPYRTGA